MLRLTGQRNTLMKGWELKYLLVYSLAAVTIRKIRALRIAYFPPFLEKPWQWLLRQFLIWKCNLFGFLAILTFARNCKYVCRHFYEMDIYGKPLSNFIHKRFNPWPSFWLTELTVLPQLYISPIPSHKSPMVRTSNVFPCCINTYWGFLKTFLNKTLGVPHISRPVIALTDMERSRLLRETLALLKVLDECYPDKPE